MVESNQKLMSNETLECMQRSYLAMWVKMGEDEGTKEDEQAAPAATVKAAWYRLFIKVMLLYDTFVLLILLLGYGFVVASDSSVIIFPNKLGLPDWFCIGACYCGFVLFQFSSVVAWRDSD